MLRSFCPQLLRNVVNQPLGAIIFVGTVVSGIGKHVELHIPGRSELLDTPPDWPFRLCPGSLNVRVSQNGYPSFFREHQLPNSVASLDARCFPGHFEIAQDQLGNNKLVPTKINPQKGTAQVWRAHLTTDDNEVSCWVLRRYGSGLTDQLEIVSDRHLRTEYHLKDGQKVTVRLLPTSAAGSALPAT